MAVLWCAIYVVTILLVGLAVTTAALGPQRRTIPETIALVVLLGLGSTGTILMWVSMAGLRPNRAVVLMLAALAVVTLLFLALRVGWRIQLDLPVLGKQDAWLALPALGLLGANIIVMIPALGFGYFEWDAFVIWAFKAKVMHDSALGPNWPRYFNDLNLSFSHLDYPLLLPSLVAGAYGTMGELDERLGKVVLPLIFAGQSLAAYVACRYWLGRFLSLMLALVLVAAPFSLTFAGLGNADTVLATFYLGSIFYAVRWVSQRQGPDILLAALFTIFAATTKAEGLPLAIITVAILFVDMISRRPREWTDFAVFFIIVLVGVGAWLAWRAGLPRTHDDYAARLRPVIVFQNLDRLGVILVALGKALMNFKEWGLLWLLALFLAGLGFRAFAWRDAQVLWAVLLAHIGLYILIYVITDWDVQELISTTIDRLLLHVAPAALLIGAVHCSSLFGPPRTRIESPPPEPVDF